MKDRSALVTGASSGIGATYADRLARRGHDLVLVARDKVRLETLAQRLRAETGVVVEVLAADLTAPEERAGVEARLREDQRIGLLINNAGAALLGGFANPDLDALDRLIQLNVTAVTRLAAAVTPRFLAEGAGAIVNVASVLALAPEIVPGIYPATKAFVLTLSQSMQAELGPRGIYVQAVLPGATRTEIWERAGRDPNTVPGLMGVDELVDAALVGFDRREPITIPPLPDAGQWDAFSGARTAMLPNFRQEHPAARDRAKIQEQDKRILVVGAGAIGGYFGGRLLQAGRDVTFLVRPRRAAQLAKTGLSIRSPRGDADITAPTVTADQLRASYDLVVLSCKAYDLAEAMDSFAPAVGPATLILPLLNGMAHLELLEQRFGAAAVLGGQCLISATLDGEGRVRHLADAHNLSFGARDGARPAGLEAIAKNLAGANFEARLSETILQEMWEKWVFIATGAGITCLMRSTVGDIVSAGAADLATTLLGECAAIAARQGFAPSAASLERSRAAFTTAGSGLTASMLRDVERGTRTEVDHVLGDLLRRGGETGGGHSLLRIAHAHLVAYEARRVRTQAASAIAA